MPEPKFTIIIYTPQEYNHASYMQTGLYEMAALGLIKVKVKMDISKKLGRTVVTKTGRVSLTNQAHPKTSFYKLVDHHNKKTIPFAVDLYDLADHFSTKALDHCDYVFKRNYESAYIRHLPKPHQARIKRMHLTFLVRSQHKKHQFLFFMGSLFGNLNVNFKTDRYLIKRLALTFKKELQHSNFVKKAGILNRFESFEPSSEQSIFFQTRCFPHEDGEDVKAIHRQRYAIIKLLKTSFTNEFLGGFVTSKIANSLYEDALSNVPSDPHLYLDALKKANIVIYTRGLSNSPAWKMAEYLSQGKVIIAERLTAELLVPLQHGVDVLFFDTLDEMVMNIKTVLNNEALMTTLSSNARRYFEAHVHPVAHVQQLIDQMLTS